MMQFSKWALKWQLIAGFLLCAFITTVSGSAGIFSLSQLQNQMEKTMLAVTHNSDLQGIPVRKIVTSILNTSSQNELLQIGDT